jgi:hypothetical protein
MYGVDGADSAVEGAAPTSACTGFIRVRIKAWRVTKALDLPRPPRLPWDEATLKYYTELCEKSAQKSAG